MKKSLNAKSLRVILAASMLLLIAGAVAGFIFAQKQLQAFATAISQIEADAAVGDDNIITLKQLETTLKDVRDVKSKADSIAVPTSDYPVAVIKNITNIANKSGIPLTGISYSDGDSSTTAATGTPTPTTPAPTTATPGATATPSTVTTPTGVTKKTINVSTASPVSYDNLMNFLKRIENDDMYLHITKVSLTKSEGNTVTTQPFIIEVYVR